MIKQALEVLNQYYLCIDIPRALDLLPPNTPISQLNLALQSVLRYNSQKRRNNQIVKNLLKSENFQVSLFLFS